MLGSSPGTVAPRIGAPPPLVALPPVLDVPEGEAGVPGAPVVEAVRGVVSVVD